jgi:hypothetical protein
VNPNASGALMLMPQTWTLNFVCDTARLFSENLRALFGGDYVSNDFAHRARHIALFKVLLRCLTNQSDLCPPT